MLPCRAAEEEEGRKVLREIGPWKGLKVRYVRNVMWNSGVVAGYWCEADGRSFRETLALPFRSGALPAALAKAGVREVPAQANEQASRWDREALQRFRG